MLQSLHFSWEFGEASRVCGSNILLLDPSQEKSKIVRGETVAANATRVAEIMDTEAGRRHKQTYHHMTPHPSKTFPICTENGNKAAVSKLSQEGESFIQSPTVGNFKRAYKPLKLIATKIYAVQDSQI